MSEKQHYREQIAELGTIYKETLDRGHGVITRFEQGNRAAERILAAGYRKPRTITTSEEIATLNTGTVILSAEGGVWHAYDHLGWREPGSTLAVMDADIALPATVLHEGDAK